jgi:integrase
LLEIQFSETLGKEAAMRGMGRVFKRGVTYWIAYFYRGKEYRESARSTKESDARRLLKKRLGEIGRGRLVGPTEERLSFDDLARDLLNDYEIKGQRSLQTVKERVAHLRRYFGVDRAVDITTPRIRSYAQARLQEGATPGTVNRDLAALSRMFTLAIQAARLTARPHIPKLEEAAPRQGFFEHDEYVAVRLNLPAAYQDVLEFGYYSGWRHGEILGLEWSDVDRAAGVIRLRPALSKTKDGRLLVLSDSLRDLIERRWKARVLGCRYVFHMGDGNPIGDWRKTWKRACRAGGVPEKLFHDLRRTVVRNLVRSGVPEKLAMTLTGHKTRSVFDRYDIVNEADLKHAAVSLDDYLRSESAKQKARRLQSGGSA